VVEDAVDLGGAPKFQGLRHASTQFLHHEPGCDGVLSLLLLLLFRGQRSHRHERKRLLENVHHDAIEARGIVSLAFEHEVPQRSAQVHVDAGAQRRPPRMPSQFRLGPTEQSVGQ
jgi:hypothetical protein